MLGNIIWCVIGLVVGLIVGFLGARIFMQKYLKKNPPINEKMIRAMMMQMGRTPSQKQVNQVMNAMNKYK